MYGGSSQSLHLGIWNALNYVYPAYLNSNTKKLKFSRPCNWT